MQAIRLAFQESATRHSIAFFLVVSALVSGSAYAADSHPDANRPARQLKDLLRPVDGGQPGILVAPNCGTQCLNKADTTTSPIDWLRAQLARLVS